jgi:thiol-disulfide isomerase/thioredoxin
MMKSLAFFTLLFAVSTAFSQNGKIILSSQPENPDGQATFRYEAPEGLNMPDDVQANVSCSDIRILSIPLEKKGSGYEFSLKLPESSTVLFFSITDKKQNVLDNNSGKGFVTYLKDPSGEGGELVLIEKIQSAGMAAYFLKLDYEEQDMLNEYETFFETYPDLKNESVYAPYLMLKFRKNKEALRPELIDFAEKMAAREDEKSLSAAYSIFRLLDQLDEMNAVAKKALEKYPGGEIAKNEFLGEYFSVKERDADYIANKIGEYTETFGKSQSQELDMFYYELILLYLENKDTLSIAKYKDQITDKITWANMYNSYAWRASGMDLTTPGENLDFAAQISRKSLDLVEYLMEHPEEHEAGSDLEGIHHMYADTYALILYKQKKYDLAFQYQHEIVQADGENMRADLKERYAAYAEKAKGPEFAKDYIEKQLLAGTDSRVMVEQLQKIYAELGLPEDEFENIQKQHKEMAAKADRDEILEQFGELKAIDFTLVNLEGEEVTLSDCEGTVVLLDFWATWCGPCLHSFPKMQELVNEFENENVEFFFINSWENEERAEINKKVVKLLEEEGYNFNVLFDYTDEVITNYKIRGIPSRILIDKDGNMRAIVRYSDDLSAMIRDSL